MYLARLREESPELKLISAADKLHNAMSIRRDFERIGEEVFARFSATRTQTLWYYRSVIAALGHDWDHPLVDELRDEVRRLHALVGEPYIPVE